MKPFLDKLVALRLREIEYKAVLQAVREHKNVYENPSHFIRAAIIEKLRRVK